MADLNPRCRLCKRPMVFIGISGAAAPACPADCSECATCRHPDATLEIVKAELIERPSDYVWDPTAGGAYIKKPGSVTRIYVTTLICSRCGATTVNTKALP